MPHTDLPLFAISKLEAFCGQHPEQRRMLDELVARMIAQLPLDVAAAEQAWQTGSLAEAAGLLHGARGAVAAIGAQRFAAVAHALQILLSTPDSAPAALAAGFADLRAVLADTLAAAQAWRART
ncbi:Hpt domain-containing protein [Massilia sp. TS11]|uniref:Hpt domain-containing protein n=1 Tax=Massilia sp. TS11 TaxID=2908003 RepID=UPI001EDB5505|nr:Hpt domain-containing protein [Massilia sp. TS11]MCG2582985.1 hypothetical protein [Massilia sp. TS11]